MDNVLAYVTKATVAIYGTLQSAYKRNGFLILGVRKYKKYYPACLQSSD